MLAQQSPLDLIFDVYPKRARTRNVYELAFRGVDYKKLGRAILAVMNESEFMPAISEIREKLGVLPPPPAKPKPRRPGWHRRAGISDEQIDAAMWVAETRAGREHSEPWPEAAQLAPVELVRY